MPYWKVIGGESNGGLLVREKSGLTARVLRERLATHSVVKELDVDLVGGRLHYSMFRGQGPNSGWVSLKTNKKQLLAQVDPPRSPEASTAVGPTLTSSNESWYAQGSNISMLWAETALLPVEAQETSDSPRAAEDDTAAAQDFSVERALQLTDEMIAEYSKPEFQACLHKAWKEAGGNPLEQGKARQKVCLPVQLRVIVKYGFEASKAGINRSVIAYSPYGSHPAVLEKAGKLQSLVTPSLQALQENTYAVPHRHQKSSSCWLESSRSVPPLFYGHLVTTRRVPCCVMAAPTSAEVKELAQYLWADQEGPWGILTGSGEDQDFRNCVDIWEFKDEANLRNDRSVSECSPASLKANWHSFPDAEFHAAAILPGAKDAVHLRQAPQRIMAFLHAFREVNAPCWKKLVTALRQTRPSSTGDSEASFTRMVTSLCNGIESGSLFSVVEARVTRGAGIEYSLPQVLSASLLNLTVVLQGACCLCLESNASDRITSDASTTYVDMPTASVHLFSPMHFEHSLTHHSDNQDPVAVLHCSFPMADVTDVGNIPDKQFLAVASAVSECVRISGAQRMLRLPPLAEVVKQEHRLQLQWGKAASGLIPVVDSDYGMPQDDKFFIGRWKCMETLLEVTDISGELRLAKVDLATKAISRGKLDQFESSAEKRMPSSTRGRSAFLSDGSYLKLLPASGGQEVLLVQGLDMANQSGFKYAFRESSHLVTPLQSYTRDLVREVRGEASEHWSVDAKSPIRSSLSPNRSSLTTHPLRCLSACNCGPADKRSRFLKMLTFFCESHLHRESPLIYTSFGSGGLWFDWWVLESLLSKGFNFSGAHFIDLHYKSEAVRNASFEESALGSMAAWLQSEGIPSYAYEEIKQFHRSQPSGAHLMVQCDADAPGIDLSKYLRPKGLLCWLQGEGGTTAVWQRTKKRDSSQLLQLAYSAYNIHM